MLFRSIGKLLVGEIRISFNPPSGFVLFRSTGAHGDTQKRKVSIRQADLCCFEELKRLESPDSYDMFQSAKRICAVSKCRMRSGKISSVLVSIRQADLCCFEDQQ